MKTLSNPIRRHRRKKPRPDLANPAAYRWSRPPRHRPGEPDLSDFELARLVAELPYPGRNELTPAHRYQDDRGAGSPLSMI